MARKKTKITLLIFLVFIIGVAIIVFISNNNSLFNESENYPVAIDGSLSSLSKDDAERIALDESKNNEEISIYFNVDDYTVSQSYYLSDGNWVVMLKNPNETDGYDVGISIFVNEKLKRVTKIELGNILVTL